MINISGNFKALQKEIKNNLKKRKKRNVKKINFIIRVNDEERTFFIKKEILFARSEF